MAKENPAKPFYSVLILAFFCSALVAGAAVGLRPFQEANKLNDRKKNILYAAGIYQEGRSVQELFAPIETRIVELRTGKFLPKDQIDPQSYNQLKAALSKSTGLAIPGDEDIAKLRRMEKYSLVYLVKEGSKIDQIILPVRGKGLWSTMYAYVAIDGDLTTIRGVSFYEHGETPGLGGEIENQKWLKGWRGKKMYGSTGDVDLHIIRGKVSGADSGAIHQIDGLSGATLTANGVNNLMEFWFGDHGFTPFFDQLRHKDNSNG